jgi:hypothetical protein
VYLGFGWRSMDRFVLDGNTIVRLTTFVFLQNTSHLLDKPVKNGLVAMFLLNSWSWDA